MTKVTFENVGRNKLTWTEELREVSESALYRAIKARRALASNDIYCREEEGGKGTIFAGFRQARRNYRWSNLSASIWKFRV